MVKMPRCLQCKFTCNINLLYAVFHIWGAQCLGGTFSHYTYMDREFVCVARYPSRSSAACTMAAVGDASKEQGSRSSTALQKRTKKMTYTSYEANSWKATFEQSGDLCVSHTAQQIHDHVSCFYSGSGSWSCGFALLHYCSSEYQLRLRQYTALTNIVVRFAERKRTIIESAPQNDL
jgi:hypothetical protein